MWLRIVGAGGVFLLSIVEWALVGVGCVGFALFAYHAKEFVKSMGMMK